MYVEKRVGVPIPVVLDPLSPLTIDSSSKPNVQIRSRAEYSSIACYNNALDTRIDVKHGICLLDLGTHGVRKGIVFARAIKSQNDDAGFRSVVCCTYACPLFVQVIVAIW